MELNPRRLRVVVRGAGDLGSGVLHRLWRCGFQPVALDRNQPLCVRRRVSFASAIHRGEIEVEGVLGKRVGRPGDLGEGSADIPVIADPEAEVVEEYRPRVLVDATMVRYPEKTLTRRDDAPLTIALGPGFEAGVDVDYVVETHRGHDLGRVIETGRARSPTGVPGEIGGRTTDRVLRSPSDGSFKARREIGDTVEENEVIGWVNDEAVRTRTGGVIRGLIYPGTTVSTGLKLGDVDPRGETSHVDRISDKARSVGGGVLEAMLYHQLRKGEGDERN